MTPSQQKLIDAAAEAYEAALVKGAANPYIPALEAAVTVALRAAEQAAYEGPRYDQEIFDSMTQQKDGLWVKLEDLSAAISSLIPAQEKTNDA